MSVVPFDNAARPVIALAVGDPAGIGPELAARLVTDPDVRAAASVVVVGDRRVLERGAAESGLPLDIDVRAPDGGIGSGDRPVLIDLGHLDPDRIEQGVASAEGGRFALENFNACLRLAADGR